MEERKITWKKGPNKIRVANYHVYDTSDSYAYILIDGHVGCLLDKELIQRISNGANWGKVLGENTSK